MNSSVRKTSLVGLKGGILAASWLLALFAAMSIPILEPDNPLFLARKLVILDVLFDRLGVPADPWGDSSVIMFRERGYVDQLYGALSYMIRPLRATWEAVPIACAYAFPLLIVLSASIQVSTQKSTRLLATAITSSCVLYIATPMWATWRVTAWNENPAYLDALGRHQLDSIWSPIGVVWIVTPIAFRVAAMCVHRSCRHEAESAVVE